MRKLLLPLALLLALLLAAMPAIAAPTPSPVISRCAPAYGPNMRYARYGNDASYATAWKGNGADAYLAYDLSAVPEADREAVVAVWYNPGTFDLLGSWVSRSGVPAAYVLEVNAAPGGAYPAEGWETAVEVTGNTLAARAHALSMAGKNWLRLRLTGDGQVELNLDVHAGSGDSWLFLGDSITAMSLGNSQGTSFAAHIHALRPAFEPLQINGGIGGLTSADGRAHIAAWLEAFPGQYVTLCYGTNDAWGNGMGPRRFRENMQAMAEAVLAAGKVPVIPTIPFSTLADVAKYLPYYNEAIAQVLSDCPDALPGPDLYAFLEAHPDYLAADGVHPTARGQEALRRLWAETMAERLYPAE